MQINARRVTQMTNGIPAFFRVPTYILVYNIITGFSLCKLKLHQENHFGNSIIGDNLIKLQRSNLLDTQ